MFGILIMKLWVSVYGFRIGYDDSLYSCYGYFCNIDVYIFDLVDGFINNDKDVIVYLVVIKSNY